MNVDIIHATYRPGRNHMLRRVRAIVDGHLVTFRSERERGWRCNACQIQTHAKCQHTTAVRSALASQRALSDRQITTTIEAPANQGGVQ